MSGKVGDNVYRASGVVAAATAGGISWQAIETGSTMTAVAGKGYWIDTSSNTCTITLPSSASVGDTIIFADYARYYIAACEYGSDKGIFGYGTTGSVVSMTNLVSNAVAAATTPEALYTLSPTFPLINFPFC